MRKKGLFISIEGTEGSGKSTLIRTLKNILEKSGNQVIVTREPGGTPLAEKIRNLILKNKMNPWTELLLYEGARSEHVQTKIAPALNVGKIVLCDRFTDSTLAYQSHARGLSWKKVSELNSFATQGIEPDLKIFLDLPPRIGLKRAKNPNRFEREGVRFQEKVRNGFIKAIRLSPQKWLRIETTGRSPVEIANEVEVTIKKKFKKRIKNRG